MRSITPTLTEEIENLTSNKDVAKGEAFYVDTYRELVSQVANLAYLNKDYLLFYRGQDKDYLNKAGASTFYPTIYRGERLSQSDIDLRFQILSSFSSQLSKRLEEEKVKGYKEVKKRKHIQWSILQHYEVCYTPFLDLTHSLLVACSFALHEAKGKDPFIYVFGLPYLSNRISVNTEHDIINVRLLSICPPDALRPYFQDGYLVGTDAITTNYDSKTELDFNNRLIAKFQISNDESFWQNGSGPIPEQVLYPENDEMEEIVNTLTKDMPVEADASRIGIFLKEWIQIENTIMQIARSRGEKVFSIMSALNLLQEEEEIPPNLIDEIDQMRRFRNEVVHNPLKVHWHEIHEETQHLRVLIERLEEISNS